MELMGILSILTACWVGAATLTILYCVSKYGARKAPRKRSLPQT